MGTRATLVPGEEEKDGLGLESDHGQKCALRRTIPLPAARATTDPRSLCGQAFMDARGR